MKRTSRRASRAAASLLRLVCIIACLFTGVAVAESELLWNSSVPDGHMPNSTVTATAPTAGQRTSNDSAPVNITNVHPANSQPNATGARRQASKAAQVPISAGRSSNTSAPTPAATSAPQRPAAPICRAAGSAKPSAGAAGVQKDSTTCSGRVSVRTDHPPPSCEAFYRAPPAPLCRLSRACASLGACPSLPSCSPPSASPCASQSRADLA